MKTKTIALLSAPLLVAGLTAGIALADSGERDCKGKRHGDRSEHMIERMSKKLDLNEQQQQQLKEGFEEKRELMSDGREAMKQLHEKIRNLDPSAASFDSDLAALKGQAATLASERVENMVKSRQQLAEILTSEQLAKLDEIRESKRGGKH